MPYLDQCIEETLRMYPPSIRYSYNIYLLNMIYLVMPLFFYILFCSPSGLIVVLPVILTSMVYTYQLVLSSMYPFMPSTMIQMCGLNRKNSNQKGMIIFIDNNLSSHHFEVKGGRNSLCASLVFKMRKFTCDIRYRILLHLKCYSIHVTLHTISKNV